MLEQAERAGARPALTGQVRDQRRRISPKSLFVPLKIHNCHRCQRGRDLRLKGGETINFESQGWSRRRYCATTLPTPTMYFRAKYLQENLSPVPVVIPQHPNAFH